MGDYRKDMDRIKLAMLSVLLLGSFIAISIFIFSGGIERNIEIFIYELIIFIPLLFFWMFSFIGYIIKYKRGEFSEESK